MIQISPIRDEFLHLVCSDQGPYSAAETRAEGGCCRRTELASKTSKVYGLGYLISQPAFCARLRSVHQLAEFGEVMLGQGVDGRGNNVVRLVDKLIKALEKNISGICRMR